MQSFLEYVDHWADNTPDSAAWWTEHSSAADSPRLASISWRMLRFLVHQTIYHLREFDLPPQSRVITCDRNSLEWVLLDLACQALDYVHVPMDYRLSDFNKRDIGCRVAPAQYVILQNQNAFDFLPKNSPNRVLQSPNIQTLLALNDEERLLGQILRTVASAIRPNRVATILFTSGSTSAPKGVQLTSQSLMSNALAKLDAMPQLASDRRLNILPFSHAYARTCELSTWLLSGSSMLTAQSINHALTLAPRYEPSLINGVPYVFQKIKELAESNKQLHSSNREKETGVNIPSDQDLLLRLLGSQIRMLAAGGAGLDEATYKWFSDCGYPIYQGYGLTEAGPVICSNRFPNPSPHHVGWPVLNTAVRIDEDQQLWVKGPGIMSGYHNDAQATDIWIRNDWLATGDLAEWVNGGAIRILGRADDRITLATGYNVDPISLERKIAKGFGIDHCLIATRDRKNLVLVAALPKSMLGTAATEPSLLLRRVQEILRDEPTYAIPNEVVLTDDSWSYENGLLNSKGSMQRKRIIDRYLIHELNDQQIT